MGLCVNLCLRTNFTSVVRTHSSGPHIGTNSLKSIWGFRLEPESPWGRERVWVRVHLCQDWLLEHGFLSHDAFLSSVSPVSHLSVRTDALCCSICVKTLINIKKSSLHHCKLEVQTSNRVWTTSERTGPKWHRHPQGPHFDMYTRTHTQASCYKYSWF